MDSLLAQQLALHRSVLGEELAPCRDWATFVAALPGQIPLVLQWPEVGPHVLVAHSLEGDRLIFYNSLGEGAQVGATLVAGGPVRRQEEDGLESLPQEAFQTWMREGLMVALLPCPGAPRRSHS
ncbi:MAG: hypothetical protein KF760_31900 [Candidatus Eremiobacteraeota bacterium]|nr:hypothetical protein [Candidatus Eremiobacteraeota bacterium]MCW5869441.1 hypothetical protein [Candidatus Eremiobacteraeota bacterium]